MFLYKIEIQAKNENAKKNIINFLIQGGMLYREKYTSKTYTTKESLLTLQDYCKKRQINITIVPLKITEYECYGINMPFRYKTLPYLFNKIKKNIKKIENVDLVDLSIIHENFNNNIMYFKHKNMLQLLNKEGTDMRAYLVEEGMFLKVKSSLNKRNRLSFEITELEDTLITNDINFEIESLLKNLYIIFKGDKEKLKVAHKKAYDNFSCEENLEVILKNKVWLCNCGHVNESNIEVNNIYTCKHCKCSYYLEGVTVKKIYTTDQILTLLRDNIALRCIDGINKNRKIMMTFEGIVFDNNEIVKMDIDFLSSKWIKA